MRMNLYFGDYFNDGHGQYHQVPVEVPSEQHLHDTIKKVEEKYPDFFDTFCRDYENQTIGPEVEKALLDTNYPVERFAETNDDIRWEQFESLVQLFTSQLWEECGHSVNTPEFVADAIIWVLNAFGGQIIPIEVPRCPCYQFSSGYGMFW